MVLVLKGCQTTKSCGKHGKELLTTTTDYGWLKNAITIDATTTDDAWLTYPVTTDAKSAQVYKACQSICRSISIWLVVNYGYITC